MTPPFTAQSYEGDGSEWDSFVAGHSGASSYHQFGWKQVVEKSFGHKGYYLVARSDGNKVAGILPLVQMQSRLFGNFLISVPFFNYGGLLVEDSAAVPCLLAEGRRIMEESGASHLELRHIGEAVAGLPTKRHKVTMILDLADDVEAQWKGFDAKLRNQIRKAQKSGLDFEIGGAELLDGFYRVFCRNMRDLGTPVYDKRFFGNVLHRFPETTRIISVSLDGRTIAAGIITRFRDSIEVPWASSIRDYRELCPNNLMYWEAIRYAIMSGAKKFDFGRSTKDEGTYRFKKQWGAQPVQLHWQYLLQDGKELPELNPKNPKFELAVKVWQQMPVALTNVLGPGIVKNIP